MSGVKFAYWKKSETTSEGEAMEDEQKKEILTTGEDGTLTVENLVPGTYCIQEIEVCSGISVG